MLISKTSTTSADLTGTAGVHIKTSADLKPVRFFSNRFCHINIHFGSDADASDTTSLPIAPFTAEWVLLGASQNLSYVLAAGETSGTIWITE